MEAKHISLTAAQLGIWLGQNKNASQSFYNTAEYLSFKGELNVGLFQKAIRLVCSAIESLNTGFAIHNEAVIQFSSMQDFDIELLDYVSSLQCLEVVKAHMQALRAQTLNIANGEVSRQQLYQLASDEYIWFICIHHIAADGFSFALLAEKVMACYQQLVQGRDVPELTFMPLEALVDEERLYLNSPYFAKDKAYWQQSLLQPVPQLFLGKNNELSDSTLKTSSVISASQFSQLQQALQPHKTTWSELFFAVVAAWCFKRSGCRYTRLGVPVANRIGSVSMNIPCMHMNIVPLTIEFDEKTSLLSLLTQIKPKLMQSRRHQRYRYEHMKQENMFHGEKLFGPIVNILPFQRPLSTSELYVETHTLSTGPVEDIAFQFVCLADGSVRFDINANTNAYEQAEIEVIKEEWLTLLAYDLEQVIKPTVADVSLTWAKDDIDGVSQIDLLQQLSINAQKYSTKIAIADEQQALSYEALWSKVLHYSQAIMFHIAGSQQLNNSAKQVIVALNLSRSIEAVILSLAVMKAGAKFVFIDPSAPQERNGHILQDAQPSLLIVDGAHSQFNEYQSRIVSCDELASQVSIDNSLSHQGEFNHTLGQQAGYVIYTSGSTGKPKGVDLSYSALNGFLIGGLTRYGVQASDNLLQFAPLHFDACIEEMYITLYAGAKLVLRNDSMLESAGAFLAQCANWKINVLDLPTAFWHELTLACAEQGLVWPKCIHTVIIGGEAVQAQRLKDWHDYFTSVKALEQGKPLQVKLLNTYGPTEACVVATCADLSHSRELNNIGQPLLGRGIAVINESGCLTSKGEAGELVLLGNGLADGYLNQAQVTKKQFVTLLLPKEGDFALHRGYRTGDKVCLHETGQLAYLGRIDDQIKISGYRIEPLEISKVIQSSLSVAEVLVLFDKATESLHAHIRTSDTFDIASVRQELRSVLPEPMVPTQIHCHSRFPVNASGKIDRKQLAQQVRVCATDPLDTLDLLSNTEKTIAQIWQSVLGVNVTDKDAHFFSLGGQSLHMLQISYRLSSVMHFDVPVSLLFQYSTIRLLALALDRKTGIANIDLLREVVDVEAYELTGNASFDTVLPLRPVENAQVNLFGIHPAGGLGWCYANMAAHLPDHVALYAIQSPAFNHDELNNELHSFDAIAHFYVEEILKVQPQGPYHLFGWSIGGNFAHYVASLLQAQDREVKTLTLLDSYPAAQLQQLDLTPKADALQALALFAGVEVDNNDDDINEASIMDQLRKSGNGMGQLKYETIASMMALTKKLTRLAREDVHYQYRGDVLYFHAAAPKAEDNISPQGWQNYLKGELNVVDIHCTHAQMVRPDNLVQIMPTLLAFMLDQ